MSESPDSTISEIAKTLGQRGGNKTKEKYGPEYFKRIRQIGVAKRKAKSVIDTAKSTT